MAIFTKEKGAAAAQQTSGRQTGKVWCHLGAILFAFFVVFGRSFYLSNSWALVLGSTSQLISGLVRGICWYLIFYLGISLLFRFIDSGRLLENRPGTKEYSWLQNYPLLQKIKTAAGWYAGKLERYPCRTVFLTMLIVNIPYIIFSYPAIFMGDSAIQIAQSVFHTTELSNHHPVMHTLFLGACLNLGGMIGSWNFGAFLFCMIQTLMMFAVMGYGIKTLVEISANRWIYLGAIVYYLLHPRISAYLFLVSKDILYTDFLVLFYIAFFRLIQNSIPSRKRDFLLMGAAVLGMIMARNDGIYIIVLTLLVSLFYRPFRKKALCYIALAVFTTTMLNQVLYPAMNVTPGSIREMLSVPFQQTARYVKYFEDDVTEEEKEVIDRVLDYDVLAESYNPKLSDAVKATYHGTTKDLIDYFGVWFQMLLRHPGVYIQATISNYYQYFYPGETLFNNYSYEWSEEMMDGMNESFGSDFHFPAIWDTARDSLELTREDAFWTPVVSLLNKPAPYIWAAILFILYCLRRRSLLGFIFSMPMLVQMLIFITGPTNGYYCRYEYPMVVYLPIVIVTGVYLIRHTQKQPDICQT